TESAAANTSTVMKTAATIVMAPRSLRSRRTPPSRRITGVPSVESCSSSQDLDLVHGGDRGRDHEPEPGKGRDQRVRGVRVADGDLHAHAGGLVGCGVRT